MELLAEHPEIDLVLLDIQFEEGEGKRKFGGIREWRSGLAHFLRPAREQGYQGKVICWSSDPSYRWIARAAGADEFIKKKTLSYETGLDSQDLKAAIDVLLGVYDQDR